MKKSIAGIRNVAIIAHVDHGKTTLVDAILKQTGVFRTNETVADRVLDSRDLERERGITILAKCTSVNHKETKINIVDTPGHSDFGGEVERVLGMVEGAILLVDAFEGPMPQTRFVVRQALEKGLRPILVVNKVDRPGSRPFEVVDEVLDLLINLGADDDQIDFPILFASARAGIASTSLDEVYAKLEPTAGDGTDHGLLPLLETIVDHIPAPTGRADSPMQFQVTMLDYDEYVGRIAIGRLYNGSMHRGENVVVGGRGKERNERLAGLYGFRGLQRVAIDRGEAGDILAVSGIDELEIGETLMDPERPSPMPPLRIDEPTLTMTFSVNDSPFAGRDGAYLTSRHLRDRLQREMRADVSLRVEPTSSPESFQVSGRGELHLGILIETMRREGYELQISKPEVLLREQDGIKLEPIEQAVLEVPEENVGVVLESLGQRRGEMENMQPVGDGRVRLEFNIPARGLIGYRSQLLSETRGYGLLYHSFAGYGPYRGHIARRTRGSLVAWEAGPATTYALFHLQDRGTLFVEPGDEVYPGMIVGEHSRDGDLDINVCKKKHVTNMRSSTAEETLRLSTPRRLSLEEALTWISEDELVEVTPHFIRLRKRILDRHQRARAANRS